MEDEDFLLALQLQEQFNNEGSAQTWRDDISDSFALKKKRKMNTSDWSVLEYSPPLQPERPLSIVDESWEMLDPSPDIRGLFLQFNSMFFWGKLSGVEVKWSPRMTLCAGVCSYEGRGGLCSIRLSEPLLKLRPRKDLVETLLHEMIHALLFVTQNNRDRDGHGPEFCKHMNRINEASGTKISIYHSFHDEVDVYRQHWWRCNGPCQNRRPFFGYVKRAMNRAPSARDPWWADHQRTCGGTYTKIKEPENSGKHEKKDKNGTKTSAKKIKPATSTTGAQDIRNIIPFSGRGFVLGGKTQPTASSQKALNQSPPPSPRLIEEPAKTSPPVLKPPSNLPVLPKHSVSNHKAFVNINGSPVRIRKNNGNIFRPKQRTVQDLFQAKSLNSVDPKTLEPFSAMSAKTDPPALGSALNQKSSDGTKSTSTCSKTTSSNSVAPKPNSAGSPFSKYFGSPKSSRTDIPGSSSVSFGIKSNSENRVPSSSLKQIGISKSFANSSSTNDGVERKLEDPISGIPVSTSANCANSKLLRCPDNPVSPAPTSTVRTAGSPEKSDATVRKRLREDGNSAHIFDFFQRISHSPPSSSSRERQEVDQAAGVPTTGCLSSSALTVQCPVCQSKVLQSQINEHLDFCLT